MHTVNLSLAIALVVIDVSHYIFPCLKGVLRKCITQSTILKSYSASISSITFMLYGGIRLVKTILRSILRWCY